MTRWLKNLLFVLVGGVALGSCTCGRSLPEPPKLAERGGGFSSGLPTKARVRPPSDRLPKARVTPNLPTLPPAVTPSPGIASIPEDFPADIPIFKDAKPVAVQNLANGAHNVLFNVDAEPKEVFTYYKDNMSNAGWNVSQEYQNKDQSFLSFKKGNTITNMTVARDPRTGKQVIAIMYYEEQPLPFPEF